MPPLSVWQSTMSMPIHGRSSAKAREGCGIKTAKRHSNAAIRQWPRRSKCTRPPVIRRYGCRRRSICRRESASRCRFEFVGGARRGKQIVSQNDCVRTLHRLPPPNGGGKALTAVNHYRSQSTPHQTSGVSCRYHWRKPTFPSFAMAVGRPSFGAITHRPACRLSAVLNGADVLDTFAMVTTPPNTLIGRITDRMPAILPREAWSMWLGETDAPPSDVKTLLQTFEDGGTWTMEPQATNRPDRPPTPSSAQGSLFSSRRDSIVQLKTRPFQTLRLQIGKAAESLAAAPSWHWWCFVDFVGKPMLQNAAAAPNAD